LLRGLLDRLLRRVLYRLLRQLPRAEEVGAGQVAVAGPGARLLGCDRGLVLRRGGLPGTAVGGLLPRLRRGRGRRCGLLGRLVLLGRLLPGGPLADVDLARSRLTAGRASFRPSVLGSDLTVAVGVTGRGVRRRASAPGRDVGTGPRRTV